MATTVTLVFDDPHQADYLLRNIDTGIEAGRLFPRLITVVSEGEPVDSRSGD